MSTVSDVLAPVTVDDEKTDIMTLPVHVVGSVALESGEDVFAAVSATLGDLVARIPDGETGDRSGWVGFQIRRTRRAQPGRGATAALSGSAARRGERS